MKEILTELIDEYIERHQETLELLSRPAWADIIARGKKELEAGVEGKGLDELADSETAHGLPRTDSPVEAGARHSQAL